LFDFDKDTIGTKRQPGAAMKTLSEVASILRSHSMHRIIIIGHTDSIGSAGYNKKLSQKRAVNVRDWLIRNGAIKAGRFGSVRGEGEFEPVAPNNNSRGRAKNRRVEITLLPS
jgi:OmpA-OmpF porin, OOP family